VRRSTQSRWVAPDPQPALAGAIARECGLEPITAQVLVNRGIRDAAAAERFLKPSLSHLEEPGRMKDLDAAASRIREAVRKRERILIFGDYDVDGITASTLIYRFLRLCNADCSVYLPSRHVEGYGLSDAAAEEILRRKPALLVTVDCGVRSVGQIAALSQAGIDVIVTDHHEPGPELPAAVAVVDPKRADCEYPFKALAGVGVAFKLAWAIATRFSLSKKVSAEHRSFLLESVGLVALGTVADVAPLIGENRVLVNHGLRVLSASTHPGLRGLMDICRLKGPGVSTSDLAFRLGPRINAAGRTGSPDDALNLFLEHDATKAHELAATLDRRNRERQRTEENVLKEAELDPEARRKDRASLVLASDSWHQGVLGIVASRLAERTGRVAALVAFEGDEARGSARSLSGVDVSKALEACRAHLVQCGGHAAAAGLTLKRDALGEFREAFEAAVRCQLDGRDAVPMLSCEGDVDAKDLTLSLARELDRLEPFGNGNPRPVFSLRGAELASNLRPLGADGRHLSFHAASGEKKFRAVAFNFDSRRDELEGLAWRKIDLAFELRCSNYSGPAGFELSIRDLRAAKRGSRKNASATTDPAP
jgi:single-stranded-DNA-specific exonuclease